jgi:hypothetical protein
MRDDKSCQSQHSGHTKEVEEEVRKAMEESEGVDAADLPEKLPITPEDETVGADEVGRNEKDSSPEIEILDGPPPALAPRKTPASSSNIVPPVKLKAPAASTSMTKTIAVPVQSQPKWPSPPLPAINRSPAIPSTTSEWTCETCTLINDAEARSCEACATAKPAPIQTIGKVGPEGWYCDFCGAGPREMSYWSCTECGWVRKWG